MNHFVSLANTLPACNSHFNRCFGPKSLSQVCALICLTLVPAAFARPSSPHGVYPHNKSVFGKYSFSSSSSQVGPGTLVFQDHYDPAHLFDGAAAVAADHGISVVAGSSTDANNNTTVLVRAYDQRKGKIRWQANISAPGFYGEAQAVAIARNVAVVSGYINSISGDGDWLVAAYELSTGKLLWQDVKDYDGKSDEASALVIKDGLVFATGAGSCPVDTLFPCDMITRAYDLLSGTLQWEDRFDQYGNDDYGSGLATAGNRLLVTGLGGAPNENESAAVVRAFDSKTGALLWEDLTLDPGFSNWGIKIATRGEQAFAVGFRKDDWFVRSYNAKNGDVLWEQTYHLEPTSLPGTFDGAWLVGTDDQRVVVAGYGSHDGINFISRAWVVNAYDLATGAQLWSDVYDTAGPDEAVGGLAIDQGQVFVSGLTSPTTEQMLVRTYNAADGQPLWEDATDVPGLYCFPWGVGVLGLAEEHGRVTICGLGTRQGSNYDWLVRIYDAGFH